LIQALQDHDEDIITEALQAMGEIGSPDAVPPLLQALHDQEWMVRRAAAEALGKIGTLEILKQLIQDPEINFSDYSILSLARKLAIRYGKEKTGFTPVYPEVIERYKGKKSPP
jgi:HEAT repeat protein